MAIKVVNSSPGTIKVTVNEIPKINVSVTSSSAINIEPGITSAERNKLAGIDVSADVTDATTVLAAGAVMTTGNQTIAGNKTFSGTTTLSGTNLISGATLMTAGLTVSGSTLTANSGLSVSGSSNFAALSASSLTVNSINFNPLGPTISTIQGDGSNEDLQVLSDGNVIFKLDQDNDETNQKLIVTNSADTEKFSVNEDGTVTVYGKIVSDSGGDIDIEPNGTGDVLLGNFKFDADQSVGSGQDNFVLTYDNSTGKISLEAATGGGSSTLLGLSDTPSSFTASKFAKVNSAGNAIEFVDDSNLNALVTMLKGGSTTTLTSVGDGTSTDKGVLNLGASSASLKFNTTGITIDEASPGDIEFIVATDSSGSTAFTALHIDGSTTANVAETIIKSGNTFKLEDSSGDKIWLRVPTVSSDITVLLPSTAGTLALTSQITADTNTQNSYAISCVDGDNSDEEKIRLTQSGADGAATDDIVLEAGTGLSIARDGDKITFTNTVTDTNTTDLVTDTSPQLGGNLDVQANEVNTSTSNGNVKIAANGTGVLEIRGNTGSGSDDNPGAIKLNCSNNSHGIVIKSPPHANGATYTLVLPDNDGNANQLLKTDGSGNLSWVDDAQGVTSVATGTGLSGGTITATGTVSLADTAVTAGSYTNADITVDAQGRITAASSGSSGSGGIASVLADTSPQLGGDLDTNNKNILFAKTGNTDHSSNGDIVKIGTGSTTQGELCYYTSSGTWVAADADATGTAGGVLLAIALGTDPDVDGMLLRGMYTLDHDPGTVGDELYVSTTAGDITATAPSGTGDIVRVVGYCLDSTNGQIWFNPSNDFIELA